MEEETMSVSARMEYLRVMRKLYRKADRKAKSNLLNNLEATTGLGRKHLIAIMNAPSISPRHRSRERGRIYDAEVATAIAIIGDALDWICAERMQPALHQMATHLQTWGEIEVSPEVLDKLQTISISTVSRILQTIRPAERLPRAHPGRRPESSAQRAIPVGIIPWQETQPGHFEVDLVHHGTPDLHGNLICTIQFIDVLTGWSERFAMMGYTFDAVWKAILAFRERCPIPVRQIHSDNGSEFINHALIAAFGKDLTGVVQSRGRPGCHNDNRFVEQKNSSLVRAYLGDTPFHTYAQLRALNVLYQDMWLYYNLFQPVLRQVERKVAVGADGITRIRRKQDRARTPLQRLLEAQPPIGRTTRDRLQDLYSNTNPLALKHHIHAQIAELTQMAKASIQK